MAPDLVIGVDLSPTGLGLVALPLDWGLDWRRCRSVVFGYSLKKTATPAEHAARMRSIVADACTFIRRCDGRYVFLEGYPIMGGKGVYNLHLVCEVGGALKLALSERLGIVPGTSPITSARRLVIGPHRSKGAKELIQKAVREMGAPSAWSDHEVDAWVAANFGAHELGGTCVARAA